MERQRQSSSETDSDADERVRLCEADEGDASRRSIVQFTTGVAYVEEKEAKVEIGVMRIGCLQTECSVTYCTKEETEDTERRYDQIEPTLLTFKPNEYFKTIYLQLRDNDSFNDIVEAKLALENPKHCTLGIELRRMRVKIIDDDWFPSAKFRKEIEEDYTTDNWRTGRDFEMMMEFWKFAFKQTMPGSIYILVADQVKNAIFILNLTVNKMVIGLIADTDWSGEMSSADRWSAVRELLLLALLLTLPYGISHWLVYRRQFWKVGGGARGTLLNSLIDKYFYYEESTRGLLNIAEFKVVFSEDALHLVDKGFMKLFAMAKCLGRIVMVFFFLLVVSVYELVVKEDAYIFFSLVPFFALPPAMIAYMWIRQEKSETCREWALDAKVALVESMNVIVEQTSMVLAYFARPLVMDNCGKKISHYNACLVHEGARRANDMAFFGWLQRGVLFTTVILGGLNVIFNNMGISTFTSVLSALTSCVGLMREVYLYLWDMQEVYPCLWHVVEYLNHPTDLKHRMKIERARENEFKDRLRKLTEAVTHVDDEDLLDRVDITVKDVAFSYFARVEPQTWSGIRNVSMQIKQGQLIGVIGKGANAGCSTLLRLLAGELLPQGADGNLDPTCTFEKGIFVPPHLRVLLVILKPTLWDGPLALNVFFGLLVNRGYMGHMLSHIDEVELRRGIQICRRLNIPEYVIDLIEADFSANPKTEKSKRRRSILIEQEHIRYQYRKVLSRISASTRRKIQLACALIADPLVLLLDKPLQFLAMEDARAVMECLREFVTCRGLEKGGGEEKMLARRPRTVVITNHSRLMLSGADLVITMDESGIVSQRADIENILDETEKEVSAIQRSVHSDRVVKETLLASSRQASKGRGRRPRGGPADGEDCSTDICI